jgi:DNA-binding transcriptional regulator YiaG
MSELNYTDKQKEKSSIESLDDASNPSSSPQRAKRLLILREMTGLSRDKFQQRYGIARGTLQNWESARFGGLTVKGARTILIALQAEGIQADIQWLLHGIGPAPCITQASGITQTSSQLTHLPPKEIQAIAEELLTFRRHHTEEVIDYVIPDNCMEPVYKGGDYVAGLRRYRTQIEQVVGLNCIAQTKEHGTLLRHIKQGEEIGCYHLYSLNLHGRTNRPCLYNVELISAAPVIWHRRPMPLKRHTSTER